MSRFWIGVGAILLIGIFAAFSANGNSSNQIMVHDLETECRGDRTTTTNIGLQPDDSLRFTGYFPVESTNSDMSFNYNGGNDIVLNVKSQSLPAQEFLWYDCLASGVYDLQTRSLEEGRYNIEVKHNGERVEKKVIRVN